MQKSSESTRTWFLYALVGFFVFEYLRPQDVLTPLRLLKLGSILSLLTFIGLITEFRSLKAVIGSPIPRLFIYFAMACIASVVVVNNHFYWYMRTEGYIVMLLVSVLPLLVLIQTKDDLLLFTRAWTFSIGLVALYVIQNGGQGPGGFQLDENDVALSLCVGIAFATYLRQLSSTSLGRFLWFLCVISCVVGVVATNSRGGFLGMCATFGALWWFGDKRLRNLILGMCALLVVVPIFLLLAPAEYVEEIYSIADTGDSTRNKRLDMWWYGWVMFLDNPLIGVGIGNFPWTVHEYQMATEAISSGEEKWYGGRASHSLWFTLLPELGSAGAVIFGLILFRSYQVLGRLGSSRDHVTKLLARAISAAIIAVLVNGTFLSILLYPQLWHLFAYAAILAKLFDPETSPESARVGSARSTGSLSS